MSLSAEKTDSNSLNLSLEEHNSRIITIISEGLIKGRFDPDDAKRMLSSLCLPVKLRNTPFKKKKKKTADIF